MRIGIIGFGAFTREILPRLKKEFDVFISSDYIQKINTTEVNNYLSKYNASLMSFDKFDPQQYSALITLTNGAQREKIINLLPSDTNYYTFIDEKAVVFENENKIGKGCIICAGTVITTNVSLGDFVQINLNSTVGHDTQLDSFVTCAPGVNISGKCHIGCYSYLGTNSSTRENITISNNVILGAQSTVVKHITESGTYAGVPAHKLN